MHKLSEINCQSFSPGHVVATGADEVLHWSRFMADVACTRRLFDDNTSSAWALFDTDSYRFAVALFALLAQDKTVYLPGENHQAMVDALRAEGAGFVGQFPVEDKREVVLGQVPVGEQSFQLTGSIVVFTSGSTGDAKAIPKTLAQIDAELAVLEVTWGEQLGGSVIAGTVSHQHLYGLLFLVLWPLCAGRSFWHKPFVDPVIMAHSVAEFSPSAWILSPAHLHRLSPQMPWSQMREHTAAVFFLGRPAGAGRGTNCF